MTDTDIEITDDPGEVSVSEFSYQQPSTRTNIPERLDVEKAYRIMNRLAANPSWFEHPKTKHMAEAAYITAGKIVSLNLQMERLSANAESARGQNLTANQVGSSLLKLAEGGGEGAKWAAQWYAAGENGKAKYMDPNNWEQILKGYENHSIEKKGVAPTDVQLLNFAKQYRDEGDITNATRLEAIVDERGRNKSAAQKVEKSVTVTTDPLLGNKVTRKMTEEEFAKSEASKPLELDTETKQQLSEYAEEKAAISSGDTAKGPDWIGLSSRARNLNELKTKLTQKGIDADTGRKIGALEPAETVVEETQILTDPSGNQVKVPKSRVAELMGKGYR